MTQKICPQCKKEFIVKSKFHKGKNRQVFCSTKCYNKNYKQKNKKHRENINCGTCNKNFSPGTKRNKWCSRECYRQSDHYKASRKKYRQSDKGKEWQKQFEKSGKSKESMEKYLQSDKYRKFQKKLWASDSYKNKRKEKRGTAGYKDDYNEYVRKRRSEDPGFKLMGNLRNRMTKFLKVKKMLKTNTMAELVGCTPQELRDHLEKQFKPGMTWKNNTTDGWHVDHIIPLASVKNIEDKRKLCHYTNLQPLWAEENLKKSNKLF